MENLQVRLISLSYDDILFFKKNSNGKIVCSCSKEGDPYLLQDSLWGNFKVVVVSSKYGEIFEIRRAIPE